VGTHTRGSVLPLSVLGVQGAVADGSEPTFDGQRMQVGTHLRWAFAPELGFPPGAFWLARRAASDERCGTNAPPVAVLDAIERQGKAAAGTEQTATDDPGLGQQVSFTSGAGNTEPERCGQCCCCRALAALEKRGDEAEPRTVAAEVTPRCECGHALIERCESSGRDPGTECECCHCSAKRESPVNVSITICCCCCDCERESGGGGGKGSGNGCGTVSGPGWGTGKPIWGTPDKCGWQVWEEPFTLPVTRTNWPARYAGALDPSTHSDPVLAARDVLECRERLGSLDLLKGMSPAAEEGYFRQLREQCVRLVEGWPSESNYSVGLEDSPDGPGAPQLSLRLVSQLQMSALSPYMARVLGLYFVDTDADPHETYDYCIIGVWAAVVPPQVLVPGDAPTGALARGDALFEGMHITADPDDAHLYAWQSDGGSTIPPAAITGLPTAVAAAMGSAVSALAAGDRPPALLAARVNPLQWPFPPPPADPTVCDIALSTPVAEVALSLAGEGQLSARSHGVEVASATVSSTSLKWYPLPAPDPSSAPIDEIVITGTGGDGSVIVIGGLATSPVAGAHAGIRYAIVHAPQAMKAPHAPSQPVTIFRRRTADVDPGTLSITPSSFFEVQWEFPPVSAAEQAGDPVTDPRNLPPPLRAIGYLAQRTDGNPSSPVALARIIAAAPQATPADSPLLPAPAILRFVDAGLPDPTDGYQHRTAGFGLFGQRGRFSKWSDPRGVEYIAAAPTLRVLVGGATQSTFDNSQSGGGAPDNAADPTAWVGGTLSVAAAWSGSSLLAYPDARTAELTVEALDGSNTVLATDAFAVPTAPVTAHTLSQLVADPARGATYAVTTPPLSVIGAEDPPASLTLTGVLPDGTAVSERFAVRPGPVDPTADVQPPGVVATLLGGPGARVVSNPGAFLGRPAYLVNGVSVSLTLNVPLSVPIDQPSASGQATVGVSTKSPFDPSEQIVDPNGVNPARPEPSSNTITFVGAQRLTPPAPPPVDQGVPTHIVHHLYYDPADYNGDASYTLPFDVSGQSGTSGYLLDREPANSLFVADIQRRLTAGLLDPNPAIAGRTDLQTWIDALPEWLAAYNHRTPASLTGSTVLGDAGGQRALIEHFYSGLLDDELRALADVPGNARGFVQLSQTPVAPASAPLSDTVNGNGFGRNLYGLRSVNQAASISPRTPSVGPIYTRTVRPSRAPVLYRVTAQPSSGAFILAWALDASPDIAGYLVYRATDPSELADMRWFGPDPSRPADPATLAQPEVTAGVWQPLSLSAGTGDPRLIGVVNDPRAYARDYDGSDMSELALPPGTPPDEILGVYRLAEFDAAEPTSQPGAFNYWIPASAGGTAQLVTDGQGTRVSGLRLGLGRGVAAVAVASYAGVLRVIGTQPVMRTAFVDGTQPGSPAAPADPNASPSWTPLAAGQTPSYAIVAVDVAGNLSLPSAPFTPPALVTA
jgi:hypothetical protein